MLAKPFPIPVNPAPTQDQIVSDCQSGEPYALMVLGDSMQPEFNDGEIIVVEPEGWAKAGAFVIAYAHDEHIFRQLQQDESGWRLAPLNPAYPSIAIADLTAVKGVVVMKKQPGRRKAQKSYGH
jgi:SOS-response transcriptional repressor LexA